MKNIYILAGLFSFIILVVFLVSINININKPQIIDENKAIKPIVFFKTKIWPYSKTDRSVFFPETCVIPNISKPNESLGLAYSGGGSRSVAAMIGYMRAMTNMKTPAGKDLYKSAKYVSTGSGGSWFHSAYTLARNKGYSSDILIGKGRKPWDITLDNLKTDNYTDTEDSKCAYIGARLSSLSILTNTANYSKIRDAPNNRWWNYVVGNGILIPYGVNVNAPIALNKANAADILARNPTLPYPEFPKEGDPFWLCNASVLYKPITDTGNYINYVMTPLYAGIAQKTKTGSTTIGGTWIETFASDTYAPKNTIINSNIVPKCDPLAVQVQSASNGQNSCVTIRDMIGSSSAALAEILYEKIPFNILGNYVHKTSTWSPDMGNTSTEIQLADSGITDNSSILSLLARGVTKVVCFLNTDRLLQDVNSPISLRPLFGGCVDCKKCGSTELGCNKTKVFDSSLWTSFYNSFVNSMRTGGPAFSRASLKVFPNLYYGIVGNYTVDLIVMLLQPSVNFNTWLPLTDVQEELGKFGDFPNFPNYNTIMANFGEVVELNREQTNLLASYTEWCLSNKDVVYNITDMLYTSQIVSNLKPLQYLTINTTTKIVEITSTTPSRLKWAVAPVSSTTYKISAFDKDTGIIYYVAAQKVSDPNVYLSKDDGVEFSITKQGTSNIFYKNTYGIGLFFYAPLVNGILQWYSTTSVVLIQPASSLWNIVG